MQNRPKLYLEPSPELVVMMDTIQRIHDIQYSVLQDKYFLIYYNTVLYYGLQFSI